jgi:DNA repair protein RadA/Sms
MAKVHVKYVCQQCGCESPKWLGRCPDCDQWNTFVEEVSAPTRAGSKRESAAVYNPPRPITEITIGAHHRYGTGIGEFDRVLGGGIVPGSVVLIGGDPGIGKSTILTQVANNLSRDGRTTLYISGEESPEQIKLRASRLGVSTDKFYLAAETDIGQIEACISSLKPDTVIVDSIQTMYDPSLESAPATVSQVRSCAAVLTSIAKTTNTPIFLVGHVTKEGTIAGPRVLEHMVDTVLYFEGDRHQAYRILRAVKNRFGPTDELGIFEMREDGLIEVANPSEILLSERPMHGPGSVVAATIEGTRPLLVEVQALVAPSYFSAPRRMATGVDYNRTMLILAVLEKRVGLSLAGQDVYVNIAGGVKIVEPAVDLAIAVAVASNLKELPVDRNTIVLGEVGLAGEVRGVSQMDKRVKEAARLGFERAIVPAHSVGRASKYQGIKVVGVESVFRAVEAAIGEFKRRRPKALAGEKADSEYEQE